MEPATSTLRPEELVRYVPTYVAWRIARGLPAVAFAEVMPAAVLFADISGFTSLSERLAARGGEGVEQLTQVLNAYFGRLISAVTDHGGDVVKFAGDALLAFWPVEDDRDALDHAARIAARCALEIQDAVTNFDAPAGERLSLRVGVGAGPAVTASLGGIYGRYEFVLSGPAVVEATKAAAHAEPGFCIVGVDAWKRVAPIAEATDAGEGTKQLVSVREVELAKALAVPLLDASAVPSLLAYIPASIHRRLAARQSGWLAELRNLSVIFLKLPGVGYGTGLETGLALMRSLQTELYRYEGSVNKLSIDEKGVTMLAALGLPPLAHEDDPRRAALAAMDMKSRLDESGQKTSVGVNSGSVFCGTIGDATRCEYTLIGDVVNVSARLMQAANGGVLCGETTRRMAGDRIKWLALEPISVKGKSQPLPVFRPIRPSWTRIERRTEMSGREVERARLQKRLDDLHTGRRGVLLIEGEAGIGKSTLLDWLRTTADGSAIAVFAGSADAAQRSTSYFAWRPVFRRLFEIDDAASLESRRAQVLALLDEKSRDLAPLLESVLSLGFDDNETTAPMFGAARSDNTVSLLMRLLRESAANKPLLITIEDAHWLDSASWTLAARVADALPSTLCVITTRPLAEPVPRAWNEISESPDADRLPLGALDPASTLELVRRNLGVESLPQPVADFLRDRSQGNPFFVQEMAAALVESGRIRIAEGRCELTTPLASMPFPDTVQGVVTSRIDRLPAPEQLTLKVASVVGRTFTTPVLEFAYPIPDDRSAQARHLQTLADSRLVQREDVAYAFSHAITQDVAYQLMAPTQRRELHGSVAQWYEHEYAGELAPFYPLLAKHWTAAERPASAIEYLEKSGEAALRDHANEEALAFLEKALSMATPETVGADRRAGWLRQCGEAHYNLAQMGKSRDAFAQSLALLGAPLPSTKAGVLLAAMREMGRQTLHRFFPGHFIGRGKSGRDEHRALEAARAYERLAQITYLNNETVETILSAFRSLNLAETAGPSAELARSYGNMAVVTGLMMMHGTARAHAARALATAQAVNHPPTSAYVRFVRGIYYVTSGDWDQGEADLREAIEISERGGDRRRWYESVITLANLLSRRGKVSESRQVAKELLEVAKRRGVPQVQVWSASWGLWCELLLDRSSRAAEEEATLEATCLTANPDVTVADRIQGLCLLAFGRFHRGDRAGALEAADIADSVMKNSGSTSHYLLEPYLALAEVYDGLWETNPAEMRQRLGRVAKQLQQFALMYPIGKPALLLVRGWIAAREGKRRRAASLLRRAKNAAARLQMPTLEEAAAVAQ
ncbi:MAG: AAA family ATPase [Thermoanaerobaculia bacterium]